LFEVHDIILSLFDGGIEICKFEINVMAYTRKSLSMQNANQGGA